jgi:3-oxoacyl-[acyl-carrier protein] reductase
MFDFTGRRIIVTGGSRGLGRAIAEGFLRSGGAVSICARDPATLASTRDALSALGTIHAASCDLGDAAAIDRYIHQAAETLGGIDVLVNNATAYATADEESGWHAAFNVDLLSVARTCKVALPWLERARPEGVVVNIGSIAGIRPSVKAPAYGAIKAAIMHYTSSQAATLARRGIRVNSVAPGSVTAPGHFWEKRREADDPAYREISEKIPAGRPAEGAEIADVVLFMASPAARWIYGQTLIVDGGQTLFGG